MHVYIKLLLLFSLLGMIKAHIKIIVLAALGLTGLWLAHLLAQDYQNITNPAGALKHFIGKRSLHASETNWDLILSNDPIDCFKSYLCQISVNPRNLSQVEERIWNLTKESKELQQFVIFKNVSMENCMKRYFYCPFHKRTMTSLIQQQISNLGGIVK